MSYKKAEELKQTIQSEKQRMERDADISVPYHRPKQHTLKEFLSRKTAITSSSSLERFKNMKNPMQAIKVTSKYDQELLLQQSIARQEESEEFFSNCVGEDEEYDNFDIPDTNEVSTDKNIDKEVDPICDASELSKEEVPETETMMEVQSTEISINLLPEETENTNEINLNELSEESIFTEDLPTTSEDIPILPNDITETSIETEIQEKNSKTPSPVKELNTYPEKNDNAEILMETDELSEDPILAKLRSKYFDSPDVIPSQAEANNVVVDYNMFNENVKVEAEGASTSQAKSLPIFHSLQGKDNEDMVIDLISGDVKPRKLTGAETLREKFIQNTKSPKTKKKKVGQSGLSFEMLKESLLQQILIKRRHQMELKMKADEAEVEAAKGSKANFEENAASESEEEEEIDDEEEDVDEDEETEGADGFVLKESAEDADSKDVNINSTVFESEIIEPNFRKQLLKIQLIVTRMRNQVPVPVKKK